jgi:hypothetical protein
MTELRNFTICPSHFKAALKKVKEGSTLIIIKDIEKRSNVVLCFNRIIAHELFNHIL